MADTFTKTERSGIMRAVRGRGNKVTELALARLFRKHRVRGWRRRADVFGKPDFLFPAQKVAVFIDGCFWHGCPKHLRMPASNAEYWTSKINRNKQRDLLVSRTLKRKGWHVLRIWEHEIRNAEALMLRIRQALGQTASRRKVR